MRQRDANTRTAGPLSGHGVEPECLPVALGVDAGGDRRGHAGHVGPGPGLPVHEHDQSVHPHVGIRACVERGGAGPARQGARDACPVVAIGLNWCPDSNPEPSDCKFGELDAGSPTGPFRPGPGTHDFTFMRLRAFGPPVVQTVR